MKRFQYLKVGVPVKQEIVTKDGEYEVDNLYVVKLNDLCIEDDIRSLSYKTRLHIFTEKELIVSTERYYNDLDIVISNQPGALTGYTYPITYSNRNNTLTTKFFCKFDGSHVEGLGDSVCCGLFTAREMKRSRERVDMYLTKRSFGYSVLKGVKWLLDYTIHEIKRFL
jgi:hypothetical protein